MRQRPVTILSGLAVLAMASPVFADTLDEAAIHAEPQYYLMSLPDAPVGEIAEAVLGEALGLPFKVDEDVNARMGLSLDGLYAPKALAREFGYRLWNVDVALIEKPSDGLWLIPKAELPAALAQGATMVAPLAGTGTPARKQQSPASPAAPPSVQTDTTELFWLVLLIAGWLGGAASAIGWMALRRRRAPVTALLPAPSPTPAGRQDAALDELVIPVFVPRNPTPTQPNGPDAVSHR